MMTPTEKRRRFRAVLAGPKVRCPATVYDALSARIAEAVGFELGILSGSVCSATVLAAPDLALHTLTEFAHQVRSVTRHTDLSIFVDADQGFGNALNVMRTVEELEHAGLAGLAIEDLVMPSRFGHTGPDELISIGEAQGKLRAALQARQDPSLVIVARTASVRTEPIADVVSRVRAYEATGVDGVFVTGLKNIEHLDAIRAALKCPIVLGTAPGISNDEVEKRGVRFRLQGHPPVAAAAKALYETYRHLYGGGSPADLKPRIATPEQMEQWTGAEQYQRSTEDYLR
jgi:carboxyvinyl-carboxyphosphonate phosphorylmutase